MKGFSTNIVNLISDNLRDRYQSSFQIIKELLQNADDAKNPNAKRFKFGKHTGFPKSKHPLLEGPALYFFNNGGFSKSDQRAIRSFAENSKAADDGVIGKFGLGMKSIFHLCEAFFMSAMTVSLHIKKDSIPGSKMNLICIPIGMKFPQEIGRESNPYLISFAGMSKLPASCYGYRFAKKSI